MSEITITREGSALALITVNRPYRCNAYDRAVWSDLTAAVTLLSADSGVRGLIITGAGRHFSAGDDMKSSALKHGEAGDSTAYLSGVQACFDALDDAPFPVIAAVSGACLGAGLSVALHCDFRIADETASFGVPASRIGDYYPPAHCRRLVALIGASRTKEMLYTSIPYSAVRALDIGLIDRLGAENPVQQAIAFAQAFIDKAPLSIASLKLTLDAIVDGELEQHHEHIDTLMEEIRNSADLIEGVKAFAEKRPPMFRGN